MTNNMGNRTPAIPDASDERERLLLMLAAATFVIFFQAYMVAPIIPALANTFATSVERVGLVVPAYLIPYGCATLVYGLLADRLGIHRVMFASLAAFTLLFAYLMYEKLAIERAKDDIAAYRYAEAEREADGDVSEHGEALV